MTSRIHEPNVCIQCGKNIQRRENEPMDTFRRRKTCSVECLHAYNKVRAAKAASKQKELHRRSPKRCIICGEEFYQKLDERNNVFDSRLYCSKECKNKRFTVERPCFECGKNYVPKYTREYNYSLFCSVECAMNGEDSDQCECGNVATKHPWVLQIDGDGEYVSNQLHLCEDCYSDVMNASETKHPLPRRTARLRNAVEEEPMYSYHAQAKFVWKNFYGG